MLADPSNRRVTIMEANKGKQGGGKTQTETNDSAETKPKKKRATTKKKKADEQAAQQPAPTQQDPLVGQPCPVCGEGHIIKGKTAYGCSRWKEGCTYRKPLDA